LKGLLSGKIGPAAAYDCRPTALQEHRTKMAMLMLMPSPEQVPELQMRTLALVPLSVLMPVLMPMLPPSCLSHHLKPCLLVLTLQLVLPLRSANLVLALALRTARPVLMQVQGSQRVLAQVSQMRKARVRMLVWMLALPLQMKRLVSVLALRMARLVRGQVLQSHQGLRSRQQQVRQGQGVLWRCRRRAPGTGTSSASC
jgi:hypothetical protein